MDSDRPTRERLEREVAELRRQLDELTARQNSHTQAMDELRASRDRFRDLAESTSDWVWEVDRDGRYTYVSPRVRDLLGREPDDLIGTTPFDIMPPAEAERVAAIFQRFVSRAELFEHLENVCLHADGREVVMETSGVPVYGADGDLRGYRGVDRDITERKRAKDGFREEYERAQTYLDLAGVMFVAMDAAGTVTLVNRKACEVLGCAEEQIVGRNWFDTCLPERLRENVKEVSKQLLRGEIEPAEYYENPVLTKSGAERLIAWHNTVLRDDEGSIIGHLSSGQDITERKRAEDKVNLLTTAVEQSIEGMAVVDLEGNILSLNNAFAGMHGYAAEELVGKHLSILHSLEQMPAVDKANRQIRETGGFKGEIWHARRDGTVFPTLMHNSLLRDDDGKPVGMIGTALDITERKRAEEALRESEDKYRTLVSHTPAVLWTSDQNGHTPFISSNVEGVYGYTPKEILNAGARLWFGRIHSEDLAGVKAAYAALAARGEPFDIEYRIQRKDGEWIWLHDRATRSYEVDGALRVDGVFLDVTERKWAVEELRNEKEFTETALNSQQDTFFLFEPATGRAIRWNRAFKDITGYTDEEIARMPAPDSYYSPEDLERAGILIQEVLDTGIGTVELELICKDGRKVPTEYNVSAITDEEGGPRHFISIGRDVTDRKRAEAERDRLEEQLRQAQKMEAVGQLAGGIAHDFNNILTAILGNAELLKMGLPPAGEQAEFADEVVKGANRAADLTRQLLAFARKGRRQVVPVDIHNVVTQTVSMLTRTIDKRIEIRLELHASPSTVMGDPTQLQNALLNLGVNARDAMADGGVLTYATRNVTFTKADCDERAYELTPGNFLEVRVADTGAGMDEQTQERIFEPFFTTKEVGKGTGLGLAGVYGCVKSHNGSIGVSSEPGRGATLKILLPLADADAAPPARTVASDEPVRGTGHVLIVDDEESVCSFVRTSLRDLGYTVSTCADGASGVDHYREHHREIDLVILDLIMPKMNGQDAFREMRRINPNVRALVSSGFSHTQAARQMLDDGALALLNKPFRITELSQAVAEHIQCDRPQ